MNFGGVVRLNKLGIVILTFLGFSVILFLYSSWNSVSVSFPKAIRSHFKGDDGDHVSAKALLIAAVDVAIRGGEEVVKVRRSQSIGEQVKGHIQDGQKDMVTQGDFRSHRVMYYGLRKTFPKVNVISEEHDVDTDNIDIERASTDNPLVSDLLVRDEIIAAEDVTVWIDPLDATQEYTENLVEYVTTMVCVAVKGMPIIGVIHKPFPPAETYWAIVGFGHSENLNKVEKLIREYNLMSEDTSVKSADPLRLVVSRSHAGAVKNVTTHLLGNHDPPTYKIQQAAGAGYKVIEVLKQNADAYLHLTNIKKWDVCAGNAVLNALGGKMTTLNGDTLDFAGHTDPLNTNGLLAYIKYNKVFEKFRDALI